MKYKIRVLSPLHIGCGETYNGLSYVIDGDRLCFIPPERFIELLGDKVNDFVAWIDENANRIDRLENEKNSVRNDQEKRKAIDNKLRPIKNSFNLKNFIKDPDNKRSDIKNVSLYSVRLSGSIFDSTDINAFIKQMGQVYIPGTEVKGAMRTAIFYCVLFDDETIYSQLKTQIQNFGNKYRFLIDAVKNQNNLRKQLRNIVTGSIPPDFVRYSNWNLGKIKNEVLCNGMEKIAANIENLIFNAKGGSSQDAKYDVLKYLYVGDSNMRRPDDVLSIARVEPFRSSKPFRIYNEIVIPGTEFIMTDLKVAGDRERDKKMDKIDFNENQKGIVGSIGSILNCCYRFSKDLIKEEIDYFERNDKKDIVSGLKRLSALNREDSPVLRIGKDEGFLSVTVALAVKNKDFDLYKNTLIHAIKGKSYENPLMPKTRKIVQYGDREYTSGWIQITKHAVDEKYSKSSPSSEKKTFSAEKDKVDTTPLFDKYGRR